MLYLSDFIRQHGKTRAALDAYTAYRKIFSMNRATYNFQWMAPGFFVKNDSRETTVRPLIWQHDLKPGYYESDCIH